MIFGKMLIVVLFFYSNFAVSSAADYPVSSRLRILIGSPIRQSPLILYEFLLSLNALKKENFIVDYCFVDDNTDPTSSSILDQFSQESNIRCTLLFPSTDCMDDGYVVNEKGHAWSLQTMFKVGGFRDRIIEKAKSEQYDYLFLIDSDIVLHPNTLQKLVEANKPIVSEIWWTRWGPTTIPEANVWLYDCYGQNPIKYPGEEVNQEESTRRYCEWQTQLEEPGMYAVGGLCGCTLINKEALIAGVKFKRIDNLTFWGEDRHFCVRARALDVGLFVDTHYPAYHIYREEYMAGIDTYKEYCQQYTDFLPKQCSIYAAS